ncbi:unnamed protein product [Parajaminaea phylloscopi]
MMFRPTALFAAAALAGVACLAVPASAWETERDAARQVRSLLDSPDQHFGVGVLSTLYPRPQQQQQQPLSSPASTDDAAAAFEVPLQGHEYFAPCYRNGDLAFVALPVSQNWRNALAPGANVSFAVSAHPDPRVADPRHRAEAAAGSRKALSSPSQAWDPDRPSWRRGQPSKLRFVLFGSMELVSGDGGDDDDDGEATADAENGTAPRECFLRHHRDASHWAPGSTDSPHVAKWARLRVAKVYAVGGFGDEHRIGWIDHDVYAQAVDGNDKSGSSPDMDSVGAVDVGDGAARKDSTTIQALFADNTVAQDVYGQSASHSQRVLSP